MKPFKCSKCGRSALECVQTDAIVCIPIRIEDGEVYYDSGMQDISESIADRFQCVNCGWAIPGVTDDDELMEWLEAQL